MVILKTRGAASYCTMMFKSFQSVAYHFNHFSKSYDLVTKEAGEYDIGTASF